MAIIPIQARLAGTDITDSVNWTQKGAGILHSAQDPLYASLNHTPLQNPIPLSFDYFGSLVGVGAIRSNETVESSEGGGHFVGNSVSETVPSTTPGSRVQMDIKPLASDFMVARGQEGKTLSVILHAKQDQFGSQVPENPESRYLQGSVRQQFDPDFYRKSSWISFHSSESADVPAMVENMSISFRRNFHHGILKLTAAEIAGISQDSTGARIRPFGSFRWTDVPGLSANALVSFNEKTAPQNETLSASGNASPSIVSCSNRTLRYMGLSGEDAVFENITSTTMFNGIKAPQVAARIKWGDIDYAVENGTPVYSIPQTGSPLPTLTVRAFYSASQGNDRLLAISLADGSRRFFGGSDNIGIAAGSYIEVSGATNPSNNGIYRVEEIFDGVPGDSNEVIPDSTLPPYQYLRLSRSIVPEDMGSRITVRNVTKLPIVHLKYTEITTPTPPQPIEYAIWAVHWDNFESMSDPTNTTTEGFASGSWAYPAIVPMVRPVYAPRRAGDTAAEPMSLPGVFEDFVQRMNLIPKGKRVVAARYWYQMFGKGPPNAGGVNYGEPFANYEEYYKDTADGYNFNGVTFLSPWADVELQDGKDSFRAFLDKCDGAGLTFDYIQDDKEYWTKFWLQANAWQNAAIIDDPRFKTLVNPLSGLTFEAEFIRNYMELSGDSVAPAGATALLGTLAEEGAGTIPFTQVWTAYGGTPPNTEFGFDRRPNGFTLYHYAYPAWNAVMDYLYMNVYSHGMFNDVLAEYPQHSHAKVIAYDYFPIGTGEAQFFQSSNIEPRYRYKDESVFMGPQIYGNVRSNVVADTNISAATPVFDSAGFQTSWLSRSGYVRGGIESLTEREKYNYLGHTVLNFNGVTANGGTYGSPERYLVRYPETDPGAQPIDIYSDEYALWLTKSKVFYEERGYKYLVNYRKWASIALRSDPTFWQRMTPWIYDASFMDQTMEKGRVEKAYWYEMLFHYSVLGTRFFNYFSEDSINRKNDLKSFQRFADDWHLISGGQHCIPCSNASGSTGELVDRVVMQDAFEKVLISGGVLENTGERLWRITVPPKFVDVNGRIVLQRVGTDSDLPATIIIEGTDPPNARGCWIKRNAPGRPEYIPLVPVVPAF